MVYYLIPEGKHGLPPERKYKYTNRKTDVNIQYELHKVKEKDTKQYRQKPPNTELMIIKEFHRSRNK